jgi:hypothetical protein
MNGARIVGIRVPPSSGKVGREPLEVAMPRLRYIEEAEKTSRDREMIESAKRTGAPDPRVVSIMVRNPKAGAAWVRPASHLAPA